MCRKRTLFVAAKVPSEAANIAIRKRPKMMQREMIQISIYKLIRIEEPRV
jgi:hypothetical protein